MQRSNLSLKWLELFQLIARSGSLQEVADETGLSISTVSHHLRSLESQLGVSLVDHQRRPMAMTPTGIAFLRHVDEALRHIRTAEREIMAGDIRRIQNLSLVIIEEFETEIVPALARILASRMKDSKLGLFTRPSHEILRLLRGGSMYTGICARPSDAISEFVEYPLLRDPFIVVKPASAGVTAEQCLSGKTDLPFLRYSQEQLIGRQVEAQLNRLRLSLPNRFECDSTGSILGLIADGRGWTLTTPLNITRVRRFRSQLDIERFPQSAFARHISLFAAEDFSAEIAGFLSTTVQRLIQTHLVAPVVEQVPWLEDSYRVLATSPSDASATET